MRSKIRHRPPMAPWVRCTASPIWARRLWRLGVVALGLVALGPRGAEAIQAPDSSSRPCQATTPATPATPSFMSEHATPAPEGPRSTTTFVVEAAAREVLQDLWSESIQAKEERVACIVGFVKGGVFHLTGAEPVPTEMADSLHVSLRPSLERCGPPEWNGTVHTHIATFRSRLFGGQISRTMGLRARPPAAPRRYATLSIADRAVMGIWRARWRAEGVFCVLYSGSEAYCEYGTELNGDTFYADESEEPSFR